MSDNSSSGPAPTDETATVDDIRVAEDQPVSEGDSSANGGRVEDLKSLCQLMLNPESVASSTQCLDDFKTGSSHERLFVRQQREQERRRRHFLPPPITTLLNNNLVHPVDTINAVAEQARFNMLSKFGPCLMPIEEDTHEKCPICLDLYILSDVLRRLRCGHIFHQHCIDQWVWKDLTCPICRSISLRFNKPVIPPPAAPTSTQENSEQHQDPVPLEEQQPNNDL